MVDRCVPVRMQTPLLLPVMLFAVFSACMLTVWLDAMALRLLPWWLVSLPMSHIMWSCWHDLPRHLRSIPWAGMFIIIYCNNFIIACSWTILHGRF